MNPAKEILFAITILVASTCNLAAAGNSAKTLDGKTTKPVLAPKSVVLPLEVDMTAAKTFVRLGFGLDDSVNFYALEMLTPRLRTVQAQQLIGLVESYNNFSGKKVADALGEFRGAVSGVRFGREGSPVLYIDLPYWTHQQEESTLQEGQRIPEDATLKLVRRLEEVFVRELGADEFSSDEHEVRVWWD